MTKRHFIGIANWLIRHKLYNKTELVEDLCIMFSNFNPRFRTSRFKKYLDDYGDSYDDR